MTVKLDVPAVSSSPALDYGDFLRRKSQANTGSGFEPTWLPDFLYPFQRHLVEWAARQGRAAIFADCFLPDTLVKADGRYRPISDCREGMAIETLMGPASIERTMSRPYRGDVVRIVTASGFFPLSVTPDHKFYVLRRSRCVHRSRSNTCCSPDCNTYCSTAVKPHVAYKIGLVSAGELTTDDCLLYRQPMEPCGEHSSSDEMLRIAGYWLAEGSLSRQNGKLYGIHFGFHVNETETLAADVVSSFAAVGTMARVQHTKVKNNVIVVSASNHRTATWLRDNFGELSHAKRLPSWFSGLAPAKQLVLLKALFEGDAHINLAAPATRYDGRLSESIRFVTVSYELAAGVRDALLGLGIRCSCMREAARTDKKGVRHREAYRIQIPRRFMGLFGYEVPVIRRDLKQVEHAENGQVYTLIPIRSIGRGSYDGMVYNLTSSGHDSYLTDAGTSKNCGLGKTPMQLAWAENVVRHTNKPVLILTPLAVSHQVVREAEKFGIEAHRSADGRPRPNITVTNYERLDKFDPDDYSGAVLDEASIIKHWTGATQKAATRFLSKLPYRLLCTATPMPNDYIEMGTLSEALGDLTHSDMLATFFRQISDDEKKKRATADDIMHSRRLSWRVIQSFGQWALKPHAFEPFWKWVSSWARACRKPSDLGDFDDSVFVLPELRRRDHIVEARRPPDGWLFTVPAFGLNQERAERRRTLVERSDLVVDLVKDHDLSVIWCHMNDEGDRLERDIPNSLQVAGKHDIDYKETVIEWFLGQKCLCDDKRFSAKIASWHSTDVIDEHKTGSSTCPRRTPSGAGNMPVSTITSTSGCGNALQSKPRDATPTGGSDTPATRNTRRKSARASSGTERRTRKSGSPGNCDGGGSPSSNTVPPSPPAVPFAGGQPAMTGAGTDSTPTIAMSPSNSEASSAHLAISDSASSGTTPSVSNGRPCICGHLSGVRRLITKPKVAGLGLNLQHCAHVVTFVTHSYEQFYQCVRRCYRFGQKRPVTLDVIATEGEINVRRNMDRKEVLASQMFDSVVRYMNESLSVDNTRYALPTEVPSWLAETR